MTTIDEVAEDWVWIDVGSQAMQEMGHLGTPRERCSPRISHRAHAVGAIRVLCESAGAPGPTAHP